MQSVIRGVTKQTADITIIGGGAIGSSIALHLAQADKNLKIKVIERDNSYKLCSAMLSAGGIRQQFSVKENILMSMYGASFLKNMDNLAIGNDIPDIQLHEIGYLFLAGDNPAHKKVLESNHKAQHECGATWISLLNKSELSEKFKWLNTDDLSIGTYGVKNEGYFDPWSFIMAMKRKAVSLGVEYIEGNIIGANVSNKNGSVSLHEVKSININDGKNEINLASKYYVNAAGAWAGELVNLLASKTSNPKSIFKLPVKPRKRCIFSVHCPERSASKPVPPPSTPLTIDPSGVYFRPEGKGGKFIVGVSPTEENDPDCTERDLSHVDHKLFEDVIWPTLYHRVPAFEELKVQSSWAGFYEYNTVDQNAIIGFHSELNNLLLCNGFSGHGLQQSPAAGRACSELMLHNKYQTIDLTRFSFDRIVDNKPIFETGIV
jgi:FAD-dependent oxidoreductase domain-containing protein 1